MKGSRSPGERYADKCSLTLPCSHVARRFDGGCEPVRRGDLIHYSNAPLGEIESATQRPRHGEGFRKFDKPNGLWVSVLGRDDWSSWCRSENFRQTRSQAAARIHLADSARVLRVASEGELDAFTLRYGFDHHWGKWTDKVIDWGRVACDWQGLIIAPYIWSRRLHDLTDWYYTWDCASGCIWDAAAIERVEHVREGRSAKLGAAAA